MSASRVSSSKCYEGVVERWKHTSEVLGEECSDMHFHVFIPHSAKPSQPVPVVYWLSGLTCTDENFITKAGAQRSAHLNDVALVCPDTSPRGCNIPGESDSWDFGTGAGFYVDASEEKWRKNYRMFSYVTQELPSVIREHFPTLNVDNASIMGHSMGGHGALICALKQVHKYKSVSAFAPICHPINCPWGKKAFTGYLGEDVKNWLEWDATELVKTWKERGGGALHVLIDQGSSDKFLLEHQLLPNDFQSAYVLANLDETDLILRMQDGYDHSYYFISTFIEEHIAYHAKFLHNK